MSDFWWNRLPQYWHGYGLVSEWIRRCVDRVELLLKVLPHCLHEKIRSLLCTALEMNKALLLLKAKSNFTWHVWLKNTAMGYVGHTKLKLKGPKCKIWLLIGMGSFMREPYSHRYFMMARKPQNHFRVNFYTAALSRLWLFIYSHPVIGFLLSKQSRRLVLIY